MFRIRDMYEKKLNGFIQDEFVFAEDEKFNFEAIDQDGEEDEDESEVSSEHHKMNSAPPQPPPLP